MLNAMYKGLVALLVILMIGNISGNAFAQSGEGKIGVVDFQRVIDASDEGKQAQEVVKKKFDELTQQAKQLEEEFKMMKAEYDNQAAVLTLEARSKKLDELERKEVEYKRFVQDSELEVRKAEQRALQELYNEIKKVVFEYGKQEHYMLILERQSVLYVGESIDLTDEIIRVYNARK